MGEERFGRGRGGRGGKQKLPDKEESSNMQAGKKNSSLGQGELLQGALSHKGERRGSYRGDMNGKRDEDQKKDWHRDEELNGSRMRRGGQH